MKITAISNAQGYNSKKNSVSINSMYKSENFSNKNLEPSFKGYVNGNWYKDEIIKLAKEYRYRSDWKQELRRGKESVEHAIENWHQEYITEAPKTNRFFLGIITLGVSEVLMDTTKAIEAIAHNRNIENTINEISKCIDDLRYDP